MNSLMNTDYYRYLKRKKTFIVGIASNWCTNCCKYEEFFKVLKEKYLNNETLTMIVDNIYLIYHLRKGKKWRY